MKLTREQLAALPPRELDARVMHTVFGWRWMVPKNRGSRAALVPPVPESFDVPNVWQPSPWGEGVWMDFDGWPTDEQRLRDWDRSCIMWLRVGMRSKMPAPSTDPGDAWAVAEELADCGFSFCISRNLFAKSWSAKTEKSVHSIGGHALADTMPRAVCLAALAALEKR